MEKEVEFLRGQVEYLESELQRYRSKAVAEQQQLDAKADAAAAEAEAVAEDNARFRAFVTCIILIIACTIVALPIAIYYGSSHAESSRIRECDTACGDSGVASVDEEKCRCK